MVVRHRIYESRENSVVRVLCNRCRIEVNSGDWFDLEDSVATAVHEARGVPRCSAMSRGKESGICGMVWRWRVSRTCSSE